MSSEAVGAGTTDAVANNTTKPDGGQEAVIVVLAALWHRRLLLMVLSVSALLLGYFGSWLVPPQYKSMTVLMPLDQQLVTSTSFVSNISIASGGLASTLGGGGIFNPRTPAMLAIGILESRQLLDAMVQRFDLVNRYKAPSREAARGMLAANSVFDEDRRTGMLDIIVGDRDPNRARDLADGYVVELSNLVNSLSTSSARRERIFLENRLKSVKADLDQSSLALSRFSSRNATFNPAQQAASAADTTTRLQSELIEAQSQLSSLRTTLSDNNVQVRAAQARIGALQGQINRLNGQAGDTAGQISTNGLPTLRQLPLLGYTYEDLSRKQKTDEALYDSLTRQYELAKVQEAKEIPPIKVLDGAEVAKKRSSPNHTMYALAALLLTLLVAVPWIVGRAFWSTQEPNGPLRVFLRRVARREQRDVAAAAHGAH